jgi:purine-binding chemotaxis protein CheW
MQPDQARWVQWLSFRLHGGEYALPVGDVVEVVSMVALAHMPESPAWLAGMLNLRGRVAPVVDLRLRLGFAAPPITLDTPVIVAQSGDRPVGLIVDEVTEVLTLPVPTLTVPDSLAGQAHPITLIARTDDRLIMLLDLARICEPVQDLTDWSRRRQ